MAKVVKTEYRPQYRAEDNRWYSAGDPRSEEEAMKSVKADLAAYTGSNPGRRMLRITTEVVTIETEITFKETV